MSSRYFCLHSMEQKLPENCDPINELFLQLLGEAVKVCLFPQRQSKPSFCFLAGTFILEVLANT